MPGKNVEVQHLEHHNMQAQTSGPELFMDPWTTSHGP